MYVCICMYIMLRDQAHCRHLVLSHRKAVICTEGSSCFLVVGRPPQTPMHVKHETTSSNFFFILVSVIYFIIMKTPPSTELEK